MRARTGPVRARYLGTGWDGLRNAPYGRSMANRLRCVGREAAGQPTGRWSVVISCPNALPPGPLAAYPRLFSAGGRALRAGYDASGQDQQMGRPQGGRGATPGPLTKPGGGHEPCSPGQRGPFLRCGYSAVTAGDIRPGGAPGAFRAARLCQPSCAGTARARGFCVPGGGADQATGEGALASCRRRGFVRRDRLRGQTRYPGQPAVGASAETAGRCLVAASLPRRIWAAPVAFRSKGRATWRPGIAWKHPVARWP